MDSEKPKSNLNWRLAKDLVSDDCFYSLRLLFSHVGQDDDRFIKAFNDRYVLKKKDDLVEQLKMNW